LLPHFLRFCASSGHEFESDFSVTKDGLDFEHGIFCQEPVHFVKEWLRTCAINTCKSNELCAQIHNRVPVILPEENLWIYDLRTNHHFTLI
jgi:hypothetical protein